MKPLTAEWIEKAEADCRSMRWELQAPANPNFDAVCFHGQQCIEKYLKARLHEGGVAFPRTHDLDELLKLAVGLQPTWASLQTAVAALTDYAVDCRYPGVSSTEVEALDAVQKCEACRRTIRSSLGLTP